ncbi:MAG: hypothetical protein ACRC10_07110 [Thermoguttaceae bacterium]
MMSVTTQSQLVSTPVSCSGPESLSLSELAPSIPTPTPQAETLFKLEDLRVPQNYIAEAAVEEVPGPIPCRKPNKNEFFQVRSGDDCQTTVAVIEDPDDRQVLWLITSGLLDSLDEEVSLVNLRLAINRAGVLFLWPLKLSKEGRSNTWNDSALQGAEKAKTHWVKLASNREANQYIAKYSTGSLSDPTWPEITLLDAVNRAFLGRIVTTLDHPFLLRLRGEI